MRDLDDTDREILRLLLEDARRPYSDIAEHVDLSPPAVSDRIERLRELGIIRRFTVDIDRSTLREGVDVLIELQASPAAVEEVRDALQTLDGIEHVFETANGRLLATATVPDTDVATYVGEVVDMSVVDAFQVHLLADSEWHPAIGEATLGLTCAECGNTVTSEGVAATIGGERYEFCCPSCRARFEERYEDLREEAD